MTVHRSHHLGARLTSVAAVGFGVITIVAGGAILAGEGAARDAAGQYVAFVLWFNFLVGFAYVLAGVGLWAQRRWSVGLGLAIALATAAVFTAFGVYVFNGGVFEQRTVFAMGFRLLFWVFFSVVAWRDTSRRQEQV